MLMKRSLIAEEMDQASLPKDEVDRALNGLSRLNFFSRSSDILWPHIFTQAQKDKRVLRILDIATGAGDLPRALKKKAKKAKIEIKIDGCDINPLMLNFSRANNNHKDLESEFFELDILKDSIPSGYDIYICSLFTHHLNNEDIFFFLNSLVKLKPNLVLINDLNRSISGYVLAFIATRLLTKSKIVHIDGPTSVKNAFKICEFKELAIKAGMTDAEIVAKWPFRFLLSWGVK